MLGADNIIDITFGVANVVLTMVTIYLMCKHHKSREIDLEHGIDQELESTIPDPDPAPTTSYPNMQSLPAEPDQAIESLSGIPRLRITLAHSCGVSYRIPRVQLQTLSHIIQPYPDAIEVTTMPEFPDSHIYYHSLRSFLLNEHD